MHSPAHNQLLGELAERIRQLEEVARPTGAEPLDLGIRALEDWLPGQSLAAGSLVELLSAVDGAGSWSLALFLARHACGPRKALVVVDSQGFFYPPAALKLGVDLRRLIVVRPRTLADAALAVAQSLRTPAVGSVLGWYDRLATPEFRRLQLACEAGGGLGLLLRPIRAQRTPSFAALRLLVTPVTTAILSRSERATKGNSSLVPRENGDRRRHVRLEALRCRGGRVGQSLILEIDDATGDVRVPAGVAPATARAGAARASG
jgi:hypothetical protein